MLLRPGLITRTQIEAAGGQPLRDKDSLGAPDPRASGTLMIMRRARGSRSLMSHAATPSALRIELWKWTSDGSLRP